MKKALFPVMLFVVAVIVLGSSLTVLANRSAGTALDDATITTKVKYELAADVRFKTLKTVQVDTERGVVTLTGRVHTSREKQHAAMVARRVEGVVRVRNLLAIVRDH
jgi:hyperosmotically inducible protein